MTRRCTSISSAIRISSTTSLLLLTPLFGGCIYTSGRTVRDTGPRISENSVRAIELNKTTIDWVVATFGEPSNRVCTLDGAEILRYDCDVRTTEGSYLFMLAASSSNTIERTCWWFEARKGMITRAWSDKCCPICVDAANAPAPAVSASNGATIDAHDEQQSHTHRDMATGAPVRVESQTPSTTPSLP